MQIRLNLGKSSALDLHLNLNDYQGLLKTYSIILWYQTNNIRGFLNLFFFFFSSDVVLREMERLKRGNLAYE